MEISFIESKKNKLIVAIKGADSTLLNALKIALQDKTDVIAATYTSDHPLVGTPKLILQTKKSDAKTLLKEAIKKLKENNKLLKKEIKKL